MEKLPDSLTLVIPVFNEAEALPHILPEVIKYCKERNWMIILVDDGSKDNSDVILREYIDQPQILVLQHKINRGYGGALKTGIKAVKTDYTVSFDADGQHKLTDIDKLFHHLLENNADMIVGSRKSSGARHWYREFGKWIIRFFAALLIPMPLSDLNSGLKLYRTDILKLYVPLCPDSMAFSDVITLILLNERFKVIEAPIEISHRTAGRSKINTRTAFDTIIEIINIVILLAPLRFFLPISTLCFLIGLGWGIPFIIMGHGVSVGAMLAIVTGLILFTLGLITEQISHLRKEILKNESAENGLRN
jgi:glycosyltransferase involved in cell wall biosynthesis